MPSSRLAALQKSTIVRSFGVLERVAPALGARWAEALWFRIPSARGRRDRLVRDQRDWLDTIAQVFRTGVAEGHFHPGADPEQFAYDLHGAMLAFHHASRLLGDPDAAARATRAFEALLSAARPSS